MNLPEKLSKEELDSLAADVMRLSTLLTRERESIPAAYLKDEGLRKAYLFYFLPSNLHKIRIPLEELSLHPKRILGKDRLRVLDMGSGPGTSVLGVMEFFARREGRPFLEFTAVDRVAENLREAETLFENLRNELHVGASLHTVTSGVERLEHRVKGSFDLIIFSNILNELFSGEEGKTGKRTAVVKKILKRFLARDGSCVIIEPALRETSRELIEAGCGLLEEGFTLYSPCPASGICSVLANPRDWCHEDVPWKPPEIIKEIDRRTGLRKDSLKFSYLVLRTDELSLTDVYGEDFHRVVSEPLISKGKMEFFVCGRTGRRPAVRLDKDRTHANEVFERLKRGDIVGFLNIADEGKRLKVGKETSVVVYRRAAVNHS